MLKGNAKKMHGYSTAFVVSILLVNSASAELTNAQTKEIVSSKNVAELSDHLTKIIKRSGDKFEQSEFMPIFYTSMLVSLHKPKKLNSKLLIQQSYRVHEMCLRKDLIGESAVLAGWWLHVVSQSEIMDDSPPIKMVEIGTQRNPKTGKIEPLFAQEMGPHPDIARGKSMIEIAIKKYPDTLFGTLWRFRKKDRNAELKCIKWADDKKHPCRAILLSNLARFASKQEVREECKTQLKLYYPKSILTKIAFGDSLD
jgi:hypothetical protein